MTRFREGPLPSCRQRASCSLTWQKVGGSLLAPFISSVWAGLHLCCCVMVQALLTVAASLVEEHRLLSSASRLRCSAACGICPDQALFPALAGGFSSAEPPRKSRSLSVTPLVPFTRVPPSELDASPRFYLQTP